MIWRDSHRVLRVDRQRPGSFLGCTEPQLLNPVDPSFFGPFDQLIVSEFEKRSTRVSPRYSNGCRGAQKSRRQPSIWLRGSISTRPNATTERRGAWRLSTRRA